jgi:hypothetical protein
MTCADCPLALDPFASPPARLTTWHPGGETVQPHLRLAFYLFGRGAPGSPPPIWIPAFRAEGQAAHDAGDVLAKKGPGPSLSAAPLGAVLARPPSEAVALLRLRHRPESLVEAEARPPRLVSLPFQRVKGRLVEPVSGVSFQPGQLAFPA